MSNELYLTGIGMTSKRTRLRMIDRLRQRGIKDIRVLACFEQVPRHIFVDEALGHKAYEDVALPIGHSQTLSQPYVTAKMAELVLEAPCHQRILEIGTGSGFLTCVLANLAQEVFSIERIKILQEKASRRIELLALNNVRLKLADGHLGWPTEQPFDVIVGTAAAKTPPPALLAQLLADGGRLIMPIGEETQALTVIDRVGERWLSRQIESCVFVPMLAGVKQE